MLSQPFGSPSGHQSSALRQHFMVRSARWPRRGTEASAGGSVVWGVFGMVLAMAPTTFWVSVVLVGFGGIAFLKNSWSPTGPRVSMLFFRFWGYLFVTYCYNKNLQKSIKPWKIHSSRNCEPSKQNQWPSQISWALDKALVSFDLNLGPTSKLKSSSLQSDRLQSPRATALKQQKHLKTKLHRPSNQLKMNSKPPRTAPDPLVLQLPPEFSQLNGIEV